jgi:hypothetical protein
MDNTKVAEVLEHIFQTFYDNDANTKHLDHDFAQQIVDVEKYLIRKFYKSSILQRSSK